MNTFFIEHLPAAASIIFLKTLFNLKQYYFVKIIDYSEVSIPLAYVKSKGFELLEKHLNKCTGSLR